MGLKPNSIHPGQHFSEEYLLPTNTRYSLWREEGGREGGRGGWYPQKMLEKHLIKIAIELGPGLSDVDFDEILDIFKQKNSRICTHKLHPQTCLC